jgi:Telomere resolvase
MIQSPCTSRESIIDVFHHRIQNGDRLRLSKEELGGLVSGFIEQLQNTESEDRIRALCLDEIKLLEKGYPQPSVAKYLTVYRKAITVAIAEGSLTLTDYNSHQFVHQQRVTGLREQRLEHWALTYLKYTPEIYESIDRRSQLTNRDKQLNLRLVPLAQYLALLQTFLDKRGTFEARWLATAIAGLTGRRFAEVIAKGTFSITAHPYLLHFQGQLKSRAEREEGYDIVTLLPADIVLEAISRLRQLPEVQKIYALKAEELSAELNRFNQKLNTICASALMQVVPPMEGKKAVSVHNLRSLYGAIAVHFFCPELQHEYAFVQHFLGHVMDSPATGHYFRFALCDEQGQLIRDKGVRLSQVEPLPLHQPTEVVPQETQEEIEKKAPFNHQEAAGALENVMLEEPRQMTLTVVETKKEKTKKGFASMNKSEMQRISSEWRDEVERQMAELRAEFEVQLQEVKQENNVGWFVRRVESLERENLKLRLERDRAIAEAIQDHGHSGEISRLQSENKALAQELKLAQEKLNAFRRLLNGDVADPSKAVAKKTVEREQKNALPPNFAEEETAEKSKVAWQEESVNGSSKPEETTKVAKATTGASARGPKAGKAFRRAESIFLAIKDWNRLHPVESFAINPGVMETIFRVHRQAVKEFFEAYQNELWEYHQDIGVDSPRWHNRGKDTQQLKEFVQEQLATEQSSS